LAIFNLEIIVVKPITSPLFAFSN